MVTDGGDETNGASGPEDDLQDKSQDVLVIPFGPAMGETIGLLSEQKVLCMGMQNNIDAERVTLNLAAELPNGHCRREGSNADRIETHEKRTRFSLSHDEGKFSFPCPARPIHTLYT